MQTETNLDSPKKFGMNASSIEARDAKLSSRLPSEIPNEVIESQTKKIPNLAFLGFAGAAIAASAILTWKTKNKTLGNFVGLWVPTVLVLGVYNKLVKVEDEVLMASKEIKALH